MPNLSKIHTSVETRLILFVYVNSHVFLSVIFILTSELWKTAEHVKDCTMMKTEHYFKKRVRYTSQKVDNYKDGGLNYFYSWGPNYTTVTEKHLRKLFDWSSSIASAHMQERKTGHHRQKKTHTYDLFIDMHTYKITSYQNWKLHYTDTPNCEAQIQNRTGGTLQNTDSAWYIFSTKLKNEYWHTTNKYSLIVLFPCGSSFCVDFHQYIQYWFFFLY